MKTILAAALTTLLLASPPHDLRGRCEALYREAVAAQRAWIEAARDAAADDEAARPPAPDLPGYAAKFLAMAREEPDDPAAALALARAIELGSFGEGWGECLDRLAGRHARSPEIGGALFAISMDATRPEVEAFLRRVLAENPAPAVRASAARALAHHLTRIAGESDFLRERPDRAAWASERSGAEAVRRIRDRDGPALRREAEGLLELLKREYGDLTMAGAPGRTFGAYADDVLREMLDLVVGKPAPEIEGVDLDGRPMRLSDSRGKVVVLTWWASWCGPCMAMVPFERELAERHKGRPFAILGVNGDDDEPRMRRAIADRGVAWRSWADGGPDGPISRSWNVRGWPTVYVLDPSGIIRYKGNRDEPALARAVAAALADAAANPAP